jgi:hypothetical protein
VVAQVALVEMEQMEAVEMVDLLITQIFQVQIFHTLEEVVELVIIMVQGASNIPQDFLDTDLVEDQVDIPTIQVEEAIHHIEQTKELS